LANQKKQPTELIICDDCSSDDTVGIAAEFANVSPFPVRIYINEKRKGYRGNFMDAATLCSSELIAFYDRDDIWHEDKLLYITRVFADDDDILLACHNARVIEFNGAIVRRNRQHDKNVFGLPVERSMIKHSVIENINLILRERADHFERYAPFSHNTAIADDKQYTSCICRRAVKGAVRYQRLSNWFNTRAQIYRGRWFYSRFLSWTSMVRSGGYMNTCWAFPKRSAVRDILLGVFFGPELDWLAVLVNEVVHKRKAQSTPIDVGCK
jgi:glycosyltransferase involved in cell wall biosynthesis